MKTSLNGEFEMEKCKPLYMSKVVEGVYKLSSV